MASNTALVSLIDAQKAQFDKVSCQAPGIQFEAEKGYALQILGNNDYLARVAMNNQDSLKNAITNVSAIGISLNPASKLAYLVPRKGAICLDISYMGLMHIAQQCGAIQWGQSVVVRETDVFKAQAVGMAPIHEFKPFDKERGAPVGVYCIIKTDGGDFLWEFMTVAEIEAIRDRSEAYKTYKKDNSKTCPWVTDFLEMARKTVIKRAWKTWPKRDRIDQAIHYLNTEGGEGLAFPSESGSKGERNITPASADQQIAITDRLRELGKTFDSLRPYFASKKITAEQVQDLTQDEAAGVLAFVQKRAA